MNLLTLIHNLPVPVIVAFLTANVIPYLSALATRGPSWLTGMVTVTLSLASGFLSDWAAAGSGFDWRSALGASFGTWVVASLHHWKVLSGTEVETKLYAALPSRTTVQPKQAA